MNKNRIVILDYGYGNVFSIKNAVKSCGYDAFVSNPKDDIFEATHLIIPGVGAFKNGLSGLYDNNLQKHLLEFSKLEKQLDTEIDEVSKMIANEIPLQYRILHQIEEKLYRNGLVEYKTPIFERIVG